MKGWELFLLCTIYSIPILLFIALFAFSPLLGMLLALLYIV